MRAPMYYEGKKLRYEEIFRSPFARPTEEDARNVLNAIRAAHDSIHGWVEVEAWIEKKPDGFVAVRHHAQYK